MRSRRARLSRPPRLTRGAVITATVTVAASGAVAGSVSVEPCTEEAVARGLVYVMQDYGTPETYGIYGYGCGFVDLDGDGDEDVVIIGAASKRLGLFENDGTGQFTNRIAGSGLPLLHQGSALAAADYDGDGDQDLYFTQWGLANRLLRNDGDFSFTDVSQSAGVSDSGAAKGASWGDFDGDGDLDLHVSNYGTQTVDLPNRLYRNDGDGTFTDVAAAQTVDSTGFGFQTVWFDMDRDGDVDLYQSNDRGHLTSGGEPNEPNQLWRNDDGQLVNVSAGSGADLGLFSMGLACGDFDGNGFPDLYVTNIAGATHPWGTNNPLMLNQGDGTFVEDGIAAGVDNPWTSWGSTFLDWDNNGWLDLYVNNMFAPNKLYLNGGGFPCAEVSASAAVEGTSGIPFVSYASAAGDVDGDGDLDILINNHNGNVQLYMNHEGNLRNWIRFRVIGEGTNTHAVGGSVDARFGTQWHFREIHAGGNGYLGQNELTVHYGADTATVVDEIVVRWPGGGPQRTLTNYPVGSTWPVPPPALLGDADGDGDRDLDDYVAFRDCFDAAAFLPDCAIMDFDGDATVSLADFDAFLDAYDGTVDDCNGNGAPDLREILIDPGLDADGDGALDDCTGCPADLDGSGSVGFTDLNALLFGLGTVQRALPLDFDGNGSVGFADLNLVLTAWGPC